MSLPFLEEAAAPVSREKSREKLQSARISSFCSFTHVTPGKVMHGQASLATAYGESSVSVCYAPKYIRDFLVRSFERESYFGSLVLLIMLDGDVFGLCALQNSSIPIPSARNSQRAGV